MSQHQLGRVLNGFCHTLQDCKRLATDGYQWSLPGSQPHISKTRAESITGLAFLRACIAWETFLEESFILYLIGRTAPRGRAPRRFAFPPSRGIAEEWVIPEGRRFANWGEDNVSNRAERFFRGGYPFTPALRNHANTLSEMRTIRNAIAHGSGNCWENFKTLVRNKLTILPPHLTIGSFFNTTITGSTPPQSFLEYYLDILESVARQIIPV